MITFYVQRHKPPQLRHRHNSGLFSKLHVKFLRFIYTSNSDCSVFQSLLLGQQPFKFYCVVSMMLSSGKKLVYCLLAWDQNCIPLKQQWSEGSSVMLHLSGDISPPHHKTKMSRMIHKMLHRTFMAGGYLDELVRGVRSGLNGCRWKEKFKTSTIKHCYFWPSILNMRQSGSLVPRFSHTQTASDRKEYPLFIQSYWRTFHETVCNPLEVIGHFISGSSIRQNGSKTLENVLMWQSLSPSHLNPWSTFKSMLITWFHLPHSPAFNTTVLASFPLLVVRYCKEQKLGGSLGTELSSSYST